MRNKVLISQKGITLVALVITIILLLLLAAITLNLTIGEKGIFNMAKRSKNETKRLQIKEEIEFAILDIQAECITNSEMEMTEKLEEELPKKLKDITIGKDEQGQLIGEYKNYDYIITKEYEVIVEEIGTKPLITYTISDETIGINEVTILLRATIQEGTITKIIKPDKTEDENVNEVSYKVTQNGRYQFTVEASNGTKRTKIIHITNLKPIAPSIQTNEAYPVLTPYGVEGAKIKIIYEKNENLENYYSEDNGVTWKIYDGEFEPKSTMIIAKSVMKANSDCYSQIQGEISLPSDALGKEAYDGDDNTYMLPRIGGSTPREFYIEVSEQMQRKTIIFLRSMGAYTTHGIKFYNENNEEISNDIRKGHVKNLETEHVIPEGTKKIGFYYSSTESQDWGEIIEIKIKNQPLFQITSYYPKIGQMQIEKGYNKIKIEYFETSDQCLYKIDDGEWKSYQKEEIRLEIGETIYAKGIDKTGKETVITKYESILPSDALGKEAYDGDDNTYMLPRIRGSTPREFYIEVSEQMQRKTIIFLRSMGHYTTHGIKFYNENNEEISNDIRKGHVKNLETEHVIPEGTKKIGFYYSSTESQDWGEIIEIKIKK